MDRRKGKTQDALCPLPGTACSGGPPSRAESSKGDQAGLVHMRR